MTWSPKDDFAILASTKRREEPLWRLLRAAVQRGGVGLVAVDKGHRVIRFQREGYVAHQGAGRKFALDVPNDTFAVDLGIKERADTDLGLDLLRRNMDFDFGPVSAIALTRHILGVVPAQPKVVLGICPWHCRDQRRAADQPADESHWNTRAMSQPPGSPANFSASHPTSNRSPA